MKNYLDKEKKQGCTPTNEFLLYQLLLATRELHLKSVMHRDLKPENLLIQQINDDFEYLWLKIADFGCAR